ncbi:MAG: nucleotide exchange factor GrpE [Nitrososphaerales archaeon]
MAEENQDIEGNQDFDSDSLAGKDTKNMVEDLLKELKQKDEKISDLSSRMLYLQSDLVNVERGNQRRIREARDETRLKFIITLISLKEDLERAISISSTSSSKNLFDGLNMLLSRLNDILRQEGVDRIDVSPGSRFDVKLHEAVAYSTGESDGTISSVIRPGYFLEGKVIQPVLVEVVRRESSTLQNSTKEEKELGLEKVARTSSAERESTRL